MTTHSACTPPPVTTVSRESEPPNDSIQSRECEQSTPENRIAIGFLFSLVMHLGLALILSLLVYVPKQASWLTIQLSNVAMTDDSPVQFVDLSFQDVTGSELESDESLSIAAFDLNEGLSEEQLVRLIPGLSDGDVEIDGLQSGDDGGEAKSPRKDRPVRFFGTQAYGNKFVYILDISGSMQGRRLLRAQRELLKSVWALPEDYLFHVVLFNEGVFNFANTPGLRPATRKNKKLLERWIATAAAQSGTLPGPALKIAGDLQPDHVFFLSDGDFEVRDQQEGGVQGLVDLLLGVDRARPNRFQAATIDNYVAKSILDGYTPGIVIHTFAYENMAGFQTLKKIAEEKGGTCRFVPPVR
ncbi:MAG: hypothetical protein GY904_13875 [Planctomycetaceae bacterium]|nr:hypothetical protein [Planctomycetaceae bacterium]